MMRKILPVFLVLVLMLGLCACSNDDQTSATKPTCTGEHVWRAATCTMPKACAICGTREEGTSLGHVWEDGVCTVCNAKEQKADPLQDGVWLLIDKQKWNLFEFQPDGTCDVMNIYGKPIADYDLEQCVKTAADSLKNQYGDEWETKAAHKYHVVKIWDYYYVVEFVSRTEKYAIKDDLIVIGELDPLIYLIIINDNTLESGENDSRYSRTDLQYVSSLLTQYQSIQ